MQKLVENLKTPHQMSSFASVLKHITLQLIKSVNGHHVIQNCLKFFTDKDHIKVYSFFHHPFFSLLLFCKRISILLQGGLEKKMEMYA